MSPLIKETYESAFTELSQVLRGAWNHKQIFFLMAAWPFALGLAGMAFAIAFASGAPKENDPLMMVGLGAEMLLALWSVSLLQWRIYRFLGLNMGKDAQTIAPLSWEKPFFLFVVYKLLLQIPMIGGGLFLNPNPVTLLFLFIYGITITSFSFFFTGLGVDRPVTLMHAWQQMMPVYFRFLGMLMLVSVAMGLCIMPLAGLLGALLGPKVLMIMPFMKLLLQLIITTIMAVIEMRFYWRQVLSKV